MARSAFVVGLVFALAGSSQGEIFADIQKMFTLSTWFTSSLYDGHGATSICQSLSRSGLLSSEAIVSFPGSAKYEEDNAHYFNSSAAVSACTVQPATTEDVSHLIKILGTTRTPFGVKSGGHSINPNFSSTTGVQISMAKFDKLVYHERNETVDVGVGMRWSEVYDALAPFGVNVVGCRVPAVGVGGYSLGGGLSWLSQQYGLTIDTIRAVEIVLPNGTIARASEEENKEILWGVRGGFNNFGIVTTISFTTVPQGIVWGGILQYDEGQRDAFTRATVNFHANNRDPKAQILAQYVYMDGKFGQTYQLFYDGPSPPSIFDEILGIPNIYSSVGTARFDDYMRLLDTPTAPKDWAMGSYNGLAVADYTTAILNAVVNQTKHWASHAPEHSGLLILYTLDPFLPSYYSHSPPSPPGVPTSAFPHSPSTVLLPISMEFNWSNASHTAFWSTVAHSSPSEILRVALREGQDVDGDKQIVYGNYAIWDTEPERIWGENLGWLKELRRRVDPRGVMDLTGGLKIPF